MAKGGGNIPRTEGGPLPISYLRVQRYLHTAHNNCRKPNLLSGSFICLHSCPHLMLIQIQNRLKNRCSEVTFVEFGEHEAVRKKSPL